MIDFCTYNIRGLNNKQAFAKDFISHNKISMIALLETRVQQDHAEVISRRIALNFNWVFNYNHHSNGRIWLGWNNSIWKVLVISTSMQQISCSIKKLSTGECFIVSFVYGLNTPQERRLLWSELSSLRNSIGDDVPWSLMGDFNVCLGPDETNKCLVWTRSMLDFRDFILSQGLADLNCSGPRLTWWDSCIADPCFKKLDRCLVNGAWMVNFNMSKALILPRGISDHCPVAVSISHEYSGGRKPFQFFLHLLSSPDFLKVVSEAWQEEIVGDPWYILTTKLRIAKMGLRKLNDYTGNLHSAVQEARNALLDFQMAMPISPSVQQFEAEAKLRAELQDKLKHEEIFLRQKARVNWLKNGDNNNRFFFNACKGRWNVNKIFMLTDSNGVDVTTHKEISRVAVNYFKTLLGSTTPVVDFPTDIVLPQLTEDHRTLLAAPFSALDVFNTFKHMAKHKCPGPDGLPVEFYLAAWDIIGEDVTKGILHFFNTLHLPRIVNSSALALVPKSQQAAMMSDFRPISCCNVLYKCISKMLTARLKIIMPAIISPCQSAFVPHRLIGDNIMLAQALCRNYHLNSGQPRCALKVDIRKAFDTLNWHFLFEALRKMGFPDIFSNWVMKCISSCMLSVKVNGSLEGYFAAKSGLRQGDPLSPYLFVIAMEVMTSCINNEIAKGNFAYHWLANEASISHLIFADDVFLFSKGDVASVSALMDGVRKFSNVSALFPNVNKSQCFFGNVPRDEKLSILNLTGFRMGTLPITYLGLPLISTKLKTQDCAPLIHKICMRIDSWTCKMLSFAGRLQLLKVVLYGIQGYWTSHIFLQKGILKKLASYFIKFLWGGDTTSNKMAKVSWEDCCFPKDEGGLGLKNLFLWNKAAVYYQLWRILKPNSSSIWLIWIQKTVLKRRPFWTMRIPSYASWCLKKIMNVREEVLRYIKYKVGINSSFLLWHDPWLEGKPLLLDHDITITSMTDTNNMDKVGVWMLNGNWDLPGSNHTDVIALRRRIGAVRISQCDVISWEDDVQVTSSLIYNSIRCHNTHPPWTKLVWHSFQIPKCSFFLWLAFRNRLLTRERMLSFGFSGDANCVLCTGGVTETVQHLFTSCPFTVPVFDAANFRFTGDWNLYLQGQLLLGRVPKIQEQIAYLYFSVAGHAIWKERNLRVHEAGHKRSSQKITYLVKQTVREKLFSCSLFRKQASRNRNLIFLLY